MSYAQATLFRAIRTVECRSSIETILGMRGWLGYVIPHNESAAPLKHVVYMHKLIQISALFRTMRSAAPLKQKRKRQIFSNVGYSAQ